MRLNMASSQYEPAADEIRRRKLLRPYTLMLLCLLRLFSGRLLLLPATLWQLYDPDDHNFSHPEFGR